MHKNAKIAAQASLAAHAQGKFWLMHDKLFANFRAINRDAILGWAKELGLDVPRFTKDLDDPKTIAQVDKDTADGTKVGVQGTPSFFINGKRYNGGRDLSAIRPIIEAELKAAAAGKGGKAEAPVKKPADAATAKQPAAAKASGEATPATTP